MSPLFQKVVERVLSFLTKEDLLSARVVCSDWARLATKDARGRKEAGKDLKEEDSHRFLPFFVTPPSPRLPVVSHLALHLNIAVRELDLVNAVRVLRAVGPSVVGLVLEVTSFEVPRPDHIGVMRPAPRNNFGAGGVMRPAPCKSFTYSYFHNNESTAFTLFMQIVSRTCASVCPVSNGPCYFPNWRPWT